MISSSEHRTGSDRASEVASNIDCDIVVNIQGDEPMLKAEVVDGLVECLSADRQLNMSTAACSIESPRELQDKNIVKVVTDNSGFALYFSRAPIPFSQNTTEKGARGNLYRPLETQERLEQLRALENGEKIKVIIWNYHPVAVNLPEDISRVAEIIRSGL